MLWRDTVGRLHVQGVCVLAAQGRGMHVRALPSCRPGFQLPERRKDKQTFFLCLKTNTKVWESQSRGARVCLQGQGCGERDGGLRNFQGQRDWRHGALLRGLTLCRVLFFGPSSSSGAASCVARLTTGTRAVFGGGVHFDVIFRWWFSWCRSALLRVLCVRVCNASSPKSERKRFSSQQALCIIQICTGFLLRSSGRRGLLPPP